MDGADVTIEGADVLMQFALGRTGNAQWDDREYPQRPGTRHWDNVCGVRFRNAVTGSPATVSASLTGPSRPKPGPLVPVAGAGVGDPLLVLPFGTAIAAEQFGPFDVGDWPALLLVIVPTGGGVRLGAFYGPDPANPLLSDSLHVAAGQEASLISGVSSPEVTLVLLPSVPAGVTAQGYVAPCSIERNPIPFFNDVPGVQGTLLMKRAQAIGAAATLTYTLKPYRGVGQTIFRGITGGPYDVKIDKTTFNGISAGRLLAQYATQGFLLEHALEAMPMTVTITNNGAAGTFDLDTNVKDLPA